MADISLEDLKAALIAEGHEFKEDVVDRVFRRLENPSGCESCGANTKVAVASGENLVTACCDTVVASLSPVPALPADSKGGK